MTVLHTLASLLGRTWDFLKDTLLSKKWWDRYYWVPVAFLVGLILWLLSGGKRNPSEKVIKRLNEIKKEERENIAKIRHNATKEASKLESESGKEKERIQKETEKKVADAKDEIEKENKALKDDSEAVNTMLNDLLD